VLADKDSACLEIATLAQALADHSKAGKAIFPKSNYLFDRGAVSQPTDVTNTIHPRVCLIPKGGSLVNVRFLTPTRHGVVDYLAAVELLTMPFVLRLGTSAPLAKWLAVATGFAVILVSLLTDYKLGLVRIIPFRIHLAIDTAVATAFVVAPFLFGFAGLNAWFYWLNAAAVFVVVAVSMPGQERPTAALA
jgi:hypothetical protein